jgi:uncharacterized cysteine cluster protein YcgN (CxxCxxCC family)
MVADTPGFWNTKNLADMTGAEWEALCDGCGRCCLNKLEDEESGMMFYTSVACHLLDTRSCRCRKYPARESLVPDCLTLRPDMLAQIVWLPASCAYRRLAEGRPLEWWHPLVSGDPDTVHQAGISVRGRAISETGIRPDQMEDYLISWIDF